MTQRLIYLGLYVITLATCFIILISFLEPHSKAYLRSISNKTTKSIYIVRHSWHTGIVVATKDIPKHHIPEHSIFGPVNYIEIGWGDSGFYQAQEITPYLTINALFRPSKTVMHLVAFNRPIEKYFTSAKIVKLKVTDKNFKKLISFIHKSFNREGKHQAKPFSRGRYGYSYFFKGSGSYHIFRTCNRWVAEALHKAKLPINTFHVATADSIMFQIKQYGEIIR